MRSRSRLDLTLAAARRSLQATPWGVGSRPAKYDSEFQTVAFGRVVEGEVADRPQEGIADSQHRGPLGLL